MKKRIIATFCIVIVAFVAFISIYKFAGNKSDNTKIRIAEVTHSAFYAPFYVAIEEGYFDEVGIDIELILTPGSDKVGAAVLSNDVEIGFSGVEAPIYIYSSGEKDYLQTFSSLTKRDGQFVVSRKEIKDFTLENMKGSRVIVGRKGGMPALSFEKALKNNNISATDLTLDYSVEYAALVGSFIGGNGDFVNLFEPNATKIEKEGFGYVVASVGLLSDEVPYTAFHARKSYIDENYELIKNFTNAINKGIEYVESNDAETIAKAILEQFPDTSLEDLTTIVARYMEADTWWENPIVTEVAFDNFQNIMINANQIKEKVPYKNLVRNVFEK